jgi:hypothetical protein
MKRMVPFNLTQEILPVAAQAYTVERWRRSHGAKSPTVKNSKQDSLIAMFRKIQPLIDIHNHF